MKAFKRRQRLENMTILILAVGLVISGVRVWGDTPPPGTITANQGRPGPVASPWPVTVVSSAPVTAVVTFPSNLPVSLISPLPLPIVAASPVPVTQSTSPWVSSITNFPATNACTQSGAWSVGRTWTLNFGTDSETVFQGTSPWVSSISNFPATQNVQIVGPSPLPVTVTNQTTNTVNQGAPGPSASPWPTSVQNFPATTTVVQPTGTNLHTVVDNLPATQNVQIVGPSPLPVTVTNQTSSTVNQGAPGPNASPWPMSIQSSVPLTASVSNFPATQTVIQPTGANLHADIDNFPATFPVTQSTSPWVTSRNWTLSSGTDSIAAAQSGVWTVQQGGAPWSVSQSGVWNFGRTWALSSGTDSVTAVVTFPVSQTVAQGAPGPAASPWPVIIESPMPLASNAATASAQASQLTQETTTATNTTNIATHQTDGTQETKVVDGSGAVQGPMQAIAGSNYAPVVLAASGQNASPVPPRTIQIGGSDGTNLRSLKTDTAGQVFVNQGVPGPASSPWPVAVESIPADGSPATQNVTTQDVASVSTTQAYGQVAVTGTPSAGSAASFALASLQSVEIQVNGTWSGTLVTEVSMDSGTTWFIRGIKISGVAPLESTFTGTSGTGSFEGGMNVVGITNVRVRSTAALGGTAVVLIRSSVNNGSVTVSNPPGAMLGRGVNSTYTHDYSSVNLTTGAFVTIISSTTSFINEIDIFDISGSDYYIAYAASCGALSNGTNAITISAGGGGKDFQIPPSMCVGFEAKTATISAGTVNMTFYK